MESMKLTTYSAAFKEEAIRKTLQRGTRTVSEMAQELNLSVHTLKNWMRKPKLGAVRTPAADKPVGQWSGAERLQALLDTHALSEEERNAWCRQRGLFAHQLHAWRRALEEAPARAGAGVQELRALRDDLARARRDLARKDRALSEAAALLVLQKKYQALWEDEDK